MLLKGYGGLLGLRKKLYKKEQTMGDVSMSTSIKSNVLKHIFQNVYFITGTAYAGKSTMVKLLSEKHDGICCGENYHAILMGAIDYENQPNLSYFKTMNNWQEFIDRKPETYDKWITGCSQEATDLEIIRLIQLTGQEKKIFVDTNISIEVLTKISDYNHVAIMLCPQSMSVDSFFKREDEEKNFLLRQIKKSENPQKSIENFRECIRRVNSDERYQEYIDSGFFMMVRTAGRTIEKALVQLENHFSLADG